MGSKVPLGIDPRVDFACKMMLGNPEHPAVTIHFLNSMLRPTVPVVEVRILNPLVGKDRSEAKVIVLDVLAVDKLGRRFNIEMQTRLPLSFPSRLLFYNCQNYVRQLREGDGYQQLCPAISICLLDRILFDNPSQADRWHHSFRLRCDQDWDLVLTHDLEFHIFELPKFRPSSDNIRTLSPEEKWLYLFKYASTMESSRLSDLLREEPYREALGILQMISKSPEDFQYYESRLKFLRDEEGKLLAARQEGEMQGIEKGRAESRAALVSTVRMFRGLLGDEPPDEADLRLKSLDELTALIAQLQQRLRDRPV